MEGRQQPTEEPLARLARERIEQGFGEDITDDAALDALAGMFAPQRAEGSAARRTPRSTKPQSTTTHAGKRGGERAPRT